MKPTYLFNIFPFRMKYKLAICLLGQFLFFSEASAYVGPTPFVANQKTWTTSGAYKYHQSIDWRELTGTGDLDKEIGSSGYLEFASCGSYANSYGSACMSFTSAYIEVSNDMTWREAIEKYEKRYGKSGHLEQYGDAHFYSSDLCAGFGVSKSKDYIKTRPIWVPGTICTLAPPENYSCTQTFDKTTIDFGTITTNEINNTSGTVNLTTTCNSKGKVTIQLSGQQGTYGGDIHLYGASHTEFINSSIYFDNKKLDGEMAYSSANGTEKHKLEFKLNRNGNKSLQAGTYKGNAIFLFAYE